MEKRKIFMIMPFEDEFFEVFEMLKREFCEEFDFSNAGAEGNQQNILKDIIQPIYEADIIIADLTKTNPNVLYELGIVHSFNKKTIIITQDELSTLPFDLKQYRVKDYSTHFKKFAELVEYLKTNLEGAIDNSISYSNPIKDFLMIEKITNTNWFVEEVKMSIEEDSEKGFLDFLADIEDDINALTSNIEMMTREMTEMSTGVAKSTAEIKRVNKNSGSGTATFVRKEVKKAAEIVGIFAQQLSKHNITYSRLWDKIEINTLGLLENKFATTEENKKHLVVYLKTLLIVKMAVDKSNSSVKNLKVSMHNNIGIERSMNQAIRFVEEDLATYLTITERTKMSIEKIINKSKFVIGEINETE